MSHQIKDFIVGDLIGRDGRNSVYEATQVMGQGLTRPAALKLLHGWDTSDPTEIEQLSHEVQMMIEVGTAPHVLTVYDFGVDEEMGPWIAMERAMGNLNAELTDEPVKPNAVRLLLRQMLEALAVLHTANPPITHRDVKPRNILRTANNAWVLSDFSLATRDESQKTMDKLTVKYAAPELLDTSHGPESTAVDLYALGFSAYEYALGQELFRAQFPSIFDPYAGDEEQHADDRSKWMYWHSSVQMQVPPVKELIPDFPEDLSDTIASLMTKPLAERVGSAAEALEMMSDTSAIDVSMLRPAKKEPRKDTQPVVSLRTGLLAVLTLALVAVLVFFLLPNLLFSPKLQLAQKKFAADTPMIAVSGRVSNLPRGGKAQIAVKETGMFPVSFDSAGNFIAEAKAPRLETTRAQFILRDRANKVVISRFFDLERHPPKQVSIKIVSRPAIAGATVRARSTTATGAPQEVTTDAAGVAALKMPYGTFDIEITHPRYQTVTSTPDTGIDPTKVLNLKMVPLSKADIADKRSRLEKEIEELKRRAEAGDPEAIALLKQKQRELDLLGPKDEDKGDGVGQIDRPLTPAERKAQLEQRLRELADRNDPEAIAERQRIQRELRMLNEGRPAASVRQDLQDRKAQIDARIEELRRRAEAGDPAAKAELEKLLREKEIIEAMERGDITPEQAAALIKGTLGFDKIDEQTLLSVPLPRLKIFVKNNVPTGAIRVDEIPALDKLRVSGPVLNEKELTTLLIRLGPALKRLQLELRVDPGELCDGLESVLTKSGYEKVRVHPFLSETKHHSLLVQFDDDGQAGRANAARQIASTFVVEPDLVSVQGLRSEPAQQETE